jgi:hypothetical protein
MWLLQIQRDDLMYSGDLLLTRTTVLPMKVPSAYYDIRVLNKHVHVRQQIIKCNL